MTGDKPDEVTRRAAVSDDDGETCLASVRRAAAVSADQLEAYLARARDPALIAGIYNYCLRRCERCPFAGRCFLYRETQEESRRLDAGDSTERARLRAAVDLVRAWCEGADTEDAQEAEHTEGATDAEDTAIVEAAATDERVNAALPAAERDPLDVAAASYEAAAYAVVDPLRQLAPFHAWSPDVADALDTISWNAGALRAKLYRALGGRAESSDDTDVDPVQNDWNGSAKVARLAIVESVAAWDVLFVAGETPYDAPIRERRRELEEMDEEIARRFPRAMEFVRPGFDESDVTAAATTASTASLASLVSKRVRLRDRLRRWWRRSFRR